MHTSKKTKSKVRLSKVIAISGTPGTGKSTLARFLAEKLGFKRLDLHSHYKELSTKYNQRKQCYELDFKKVDFFVHKKIKEVKSGLIIDSHIAHLLSPKIIDLCLVLVCSDLKQLERRLKLRKYSAKKVRENLDAEIFQVCLIEAKEKRHKIIVLDTAKRLDIGKLVKEIKRKLS